MLRFVVMPLIAILAFAQNVALSTDRGFINSTLVEASAVDTFAIPKTESSGTLLSDQFFIHYWWGPPIDADAAANYAWVKECNFSVAAYPADGETASKEKWLKILDACAANGLKCIVSDERVNPVLKAKKPDDPDFRSSLNSLIKDYGDHPAVAGYHVMDEPGALKFEWLAAINSYLLSKAPDCLPYINLLPEWSPSWLLEYGSEEAAAGKPTSKMTYEEYLDRFCRVVKPKILSYDNYAPRENSAERMASYYENFELVRKKGLQYGIPTCFVLWSQSDGWQPEGELRCPVSLALAYGFRGISYFTYWLWGDHPCAITWRDGEPSPKYARVKRINWEVKMLSQVLMKLKSTGVYYTLDVPKGCVSIDPKLPVQIKSDMPMVLGMFTHRDGSTWAMVVNRDFYRPAEAELIFTKCVSSVEDISPQTGVMRDLSLFGEAAKISLRPGACLLLKINYKERRVAPGVSKSLQLPAASLRTSFENQQCNIVGKCAACEPQGCVQ